MHNWHAVDAWRRKHAIDPDRIRRMRHALYHSYESLDSTLTRLDACQAEQLRSELRLEWLTVVTRRDSTLDQSTKLVVEACDGVRVELVVLRSASGRMSVCVSTQAGCAADCPFCATGRMGLRRNLASAEIVEQVLIAGRLANSENRRLRNVVFMGMGEPLDNELELHEAIERLLHPQACRFAPRRLLVSTVGIPAAMRRLVDRFPGVQMALSLHSARPELRRKLIPWTQRHEWRELRSAVRYVADHHSHHRLQGPVMIEHLLIDGVNDSDQDAQALIDYLDGIRAHVNLIPYNAVSHIRHWRPTPRTRRDTFAKILREAGLFTTIRYSMGADIAAACGQLVAQ